MDHFFIKIKESLANELPGESAQLSMSPLKRKIHPTEVKNSKESAVAIVLFQSNNTIYSLLLQRPEYSGIHSGQICLPGGKVDIIDDSLVETAIRECFEETGIPANKLELLGDLTPVYIPVSNHHVQPFVFLHRGEPNLIPDKREVVQIIPFEIHQLLNHKIIKRKDIFSNQKTLKNIPYFDIHNKMVWGATAVILNEFKEILKKVV